MRKIHRLAGVTTPLWPARPPRQSFVGRRRGLPALVIHQGSPHFQVNVMALIVRDAALKLL